MTTTSSNTPCRDCGGTGRIRKVTIGKPPEANAETVACVCTDTYASRTVDGYHYVEKRPETVLVAETTRTRIPAAGAPVANPYADERARGSTFVDERTHVDSAAWDEAWRKASIAMRCCLAALDLRDSGVSVVGFATGDLLAHYDRVVGPRHETALAKAREAKAEEKARRDADHPELPMASGVIVDIADPPEARHDGSDTPKPEPAPAPAPDEPEPMHSTVYSWPELTSGGRARRKPKAARCEVKTVQLPNAPARIPDDHLLALIAGTDGDS